MKGIYICGVPGGGTSAVAEALLGASVNLGSWDRKEKHYTTYECLLGNRWNRQPQVPFRGLDATEFSEYLDFRKGTSEGRPWGVKCFAHRILIYRPEILSRLQIVSVDRDLRDTIRSRWEHMPPKSQLADIAEAAARKGQWFALSERVFQLASKPVRVPYPLPSNNDWIEETLRNART